MLKKVLKNCNLFVDGKGYASKVEELNPPELNIKMEDIRLAGSDIPQQIDMGMDPLQADFTMVEFSEDVLSLFGVVVGNSIPFRFKGAMQDQDGGAVTPIEVAINGKVATLNMGTWKAGEVAKKKCTIKSITYFRLIVNSETLIEIDVTNNKRIINGVDQLEGINDALGTSGTINLSRLIDTFTNANRSAARAAGAVAGAIGLS